MTTRPEALFLAHRAPYPPDKGDRIRSFRIVEALSRRFAVHVAAFVDHPADLERAEPLRAYCASLTLLPLSPVAARLRSARALISGAPMSFHYFQSARMRAAVGALRERRFALEVAFSSSMAPYLVEPKGGPRIIDLCDADSEKWRQYSQMDSGLMRWIYAREARTLAAAEEAMIQWADKSFAVSADEAAILNARTLTGKKAEWFGNGVDADHFAPPTESIGERAADVVFVGAMDYRANVDAVVWFASEVWPRVRSAKQGARFAIIGSNPVRRVLALSRVDGVHVLGRVDDIRPFLHGARAVVAPLRIARGVQNKVLEAMAAGRPIVATHAATTGIAATPDRHFLEADDAQTFSAAVIRLLSDTSEGDALGMRARRLMIDHYSWSAQLASFEAAIDALCAR